MREKRAAVFDPYLDTIGGGEVYTSSVARCLMDEGYQVDLFWKDDGVLERIDKFLGIDIGKAHVEVLGYWLFSNRGKIVQKRRLTKEYDVIFYVSDGSVPLLFSRNNILHFQIPFSNGQGPSPTGQTSGSGEPLVQRRPSGLVSLSNRVKLKNIHHIVCNSRFTKRVIDRTFRVKSEVIYPPLNIGVKKMKKENIILSVGRFTTTLHNKRQEILVKAFCELVDEGLEGWRLHLVGSTKEGKDLVDQLKKQAKGYPIELITDVPHDRLEAEYAKAKLFWHAAGYGIDERAHPEMVEHFGIATAEAMSAGCVPVVINKGGQPEIVKNGENGYLWNSLDSLKISTLQLISSPEKMNRLANSAKTTSRNFSKDRFCKEFTKLL